MLENPNLLQISTRVYRYAFPNYDDIGNAGIVLTDEGVVIIDTDVRTVDTLFTTLPELTDKPIRFLINTHHAFDHASANCIFAHRGIPIIASERCREEMSRWGEINMQRWADRSPEIGKILAQKGITVALPQITFSQGLRLHLGGQTIELLHFGHAHTPGDLIAYLPQEEILFGGDILWCGFFPNIREADVPKQIEVINRILEFPVRYYVPGHGSVSSDKAEIEALRDFLAKLYERIELMVKDGKDIEEISALEQELVDRHPDWRDRTMLKRALEVIYRTHRDKSMLL